MVILCYESQYRQLVMNRTLPERIDYQCLVTGNDDPRIGFCGRMELLIVLGSRLFDSSGSARRITGLFSNF